MCSGGSGKVHSHLTFTTLIVQVASRVNLHLTTLSLSVTCSCCRHVCIIEIKGDQYRCLNLPLYTTRPFVIADITLSDNIDSKVPHAAETVEQLLTERIDELLATVKSRRAAHISIAGQRAELVFGCASHQHSTVVLCSLFPVS